MTREKRSRGKKNTRKDLATGRVLFWREGDGQVLKGRGMVLERGRWRREVLREGRSRVEEILYHIKI